MGAVSPQMVPQMVLKDGPFLLYNERSRRVAEAFRKLLKQSDCNHDPAKHWRHAPCEDAFECTACPTRFTGEQLIATAYGVMP